MKTSDDIVKWYAEMRDKGVQPMNFLRDICEGVNDMLNPNIVYAVNGMVIKGTWNMVTNEGVVYSGKGLNGFSKTKGKRKMVSFKL